MDFNKINQSAPNMLGRLQCEDADLYVISYTNGFTQWHHRVPGRVDLIHPDYFYPVRGCVKPGDMIVVSGQREDTIPCTVMFTVTFVDEFNVHVERIV